MTAFQPFGNNPAPACRTPDSEPNGVIRNEVGGENFKNGPQEMGSDEVIGNQ